MTIIIEIRGGNMVSAVGTDNIDLKVIDWDNYPDGKIEDYPLDIVRHDVEEIFNTERKHDQVIYKQLSKRIR